MLKQRIKRLSLAAWMISLVMLVYIGRLAWLQLIPGSASAAVLSSEATRGGWQRLSVQQRQRNLVLDTGRGDFYDRNGKAITGETYSAVALFPVRRDVRGQEKDLSVLSGILGVSVEQLQQRWDAVREPVFWKVDHQMRPLRLTDAQKVRIEKLHLNGIRVLPYRNRYLPGFEAKHLIGFTSQHPEWLQTEQAEDLALGKRKLADQVGGSGLEKSLDKLMHGVGATSVSYFIDGRNAPMHGLDLRITQPNNRYYPLKTMTTIDLELQNEIEDYVDAHGLKEGAVVVLDASNADIVAMVSRPQLKPGQFHTSDGTEWSNHALKAVAPGSVFKLVTEAAALEAGVVNQNESFYCSGEYGKYGLSCWKEGGHGHLTLKEGLAQSCNIVFATVAERLTAEELKRTADALGIGQQAGWHREKAFGPFSEPLRLLEEEERGQLFPIPIKASSTLVGHGEDMRLEPGSGTQKRRQKSGEKVQLDELGSAVEAGGRAGKRDALLEAREQAATLAAVDGGTLAQSGLGQRDVRMTPLQAANLIVTLLNEGRVMEPRLVSEIRYANGQRMVKLPAQRAQASRGRIKPATAHALLRGMAAVVDHGTGRTIRQGRWAVAGKSGTAETTRAGIDRNHQWFAGYGPIKKPRYAIAVLVENQPPGSSNQATKIFRGVMDIAARLAEGDNR
ncbi:penicillin-binding transpeptidase domain-containing protein [Paenibacillus sp. LHD-38]|uniref:peptidoglycan D,D-transpeptidase FtsI family protein n=1 Tax=Paenibacillus sp. LHD-38 TaxID=3072143 RepID=UPI00280D4688|nr:penicillin-binding transpeptidase domain-containing protein [Paenibacillus sp. LHD-38]MDQ8738846.1 penicillin-binding transpeptidase domain-containing protein [Paenibacillus sp. LHD-38]